jgi:ABC-type Fe3+ transport system substrate-binding protein
LASGLVLIQAGQGWTQTQTGRGEHSAEVRRLFAAANGNGERELSLSWGNSLGGAQGAKKFEVLFNRMYGMNVNVVFTPGASMPEIAARVTQEVSAGRKPSIDVYLGTESHYAPLLDRNVLESYDYTKLSPRITQDFIAPRNIGVEIGTLLAGITYNTNLLSPIEAPKRLEDVLNPKWKGKIASTQAAATFDRVAMRPEWGAEKMKAFIAKLSQQVGGFIRATESSRIITGEFVMLVMDGGGHEVRRQKAKGAPIEHVIPEDASTVGFMYMGVPRNSPHSNLGKLFINMVMSEEGQKIYYEAEFNDHYKLPGSQSAAALQDLKAKGIKPFEMGIKFAVEHPEMREISTELQKILRERRGS